MRKLTLGIVFIILFSVFPQNVFSMDDFAIYLYDNFEGIEVGRRPLYKEGYWMGDGLKVNYCGYIDVVEVDGNKALRIHSLGKGEEIGSTSAAISGKINVVDRNFVIQGRFRTEDVNQEKGVLLRGQTSSDINSVLTFKDGKITALGKEIATLEANKWYDISMKFNVENNDMNISINEQNYEKLPLPKKLMGSYQEIRFFIYGNTEVDSITGFLLDDIKIYEGDAVRPAESFSHLPENVGLHDWSDLTKYMDGNITVINGNNNAAIGTDRVKLTSFAYFENNVAYAPIDFIMNYFDIPYSYDSGKAICRADGRNVELTLADGLRPVNGKLYVSLNYIADVLHMYITVHNDVAMMGKTSVYFNNEAQPNEIKRYVLGEEYKESDNKNWFPTREQILKDFNEHTKGQHPRVLAVKSDFDRIRIDLETDPYLEKWYKAIKKQADDALNSGPVYSSVTFENVTQKREKIQACIEALGMVYNIEGGDQYAQKAYEYMKDVVGWESWYPEHFITTANITETMAIGYDWIYNYMNNEQRKYISDGIMRLGLNPALNGYRRDVEPGATALETRAMLQWLNDQSNWSAVANAGNVMGAIALFDEYPDISAEIIESSFPSIENFYATTEPDGGSVEGISYWHYARIHFVNYVAVLQSALGTDYGRYTEGGFYKSGYFPIYLQNEVASFGFSDSNNLPVQTPLYMYFALRNSDKGLGTMRKNALEKGISTPTVYDMLWYRPELFSGNKVDMPLDYYFRNVESGSFRDSFENDYSIFFAFHGGANYASHSHKDSGQFVLYAHGQKWFEDLGRDMLTYSNPKGIKFTGSDLYRIRAEGHNVVVFNPDKSDGQPGSYAPVVKFQSGTGGGFAVLDLTNIYYPYVKDYKRGYMFTDNRTRAVVQDSIKTLKPSTFYWFAHTTADVEIAPDGKSAILTLHGRKLWVGLQSENKKLKLEVMDAVPLPSSPNIIGRADDSQYKKLFISADKITDLELAVSFVPLGRGENPPSSVGKMTAIDNWQNISKKSVKIPQVDSITLDGKEYSDFNPRRYEYLIKLPYSDNLPKVVPKVNDNYTVDVAEDYESDKPGRTVIVKNPENADKKCYYFNFVSLPMYGIPEGLVEYKPVSVTSSANLDTDPKLTIDGNLEDASRWGATNDQWLLYDLGKEFEIDNLAMALYNGNVRVSMFEVYTSSDGENFTPVANCVSSKTTAGFETYKLKPVKARYVKIQMHGADVTPWNGVKEIKIFGS